MPTKYGSPVVLHLELGGEFILTMVENYGVQGFNRWHAALCACVPWHWGADEEEPPLWFWYNLKGDDLSHQKLDGIDLSDFWCKETCFDGASLMGAKIAFCKNASFKRCCLRGTEFAGDITGADFTAADIDGIVFKDAFYDPACPPLGLPQGLLLLCAKKADQKGNGVGIIETPVSVGATLAD